VDVPEPARRWLISQRATYFLTLRDPPQYALDDRGRGSRYHSLAQPVDPTPRPPEQGTNLSRADDLKILLELPHLLPKEMREMEMVLRSYWQVLARTANGQERFKGPPPEFLQAIGFQEEEMAGRISRWERMESNQGRSRGMLHGAIYLRNKWWKEAFTDYDLDPSKPRTEMVTRQGNRVYVVKWTPELPRLEPMQEAGDQLLGSIGGGPQLIYTREQSPSMRPLRASPSDTSQPGGTATGQGGAGAAVTGAETGPTTSPTPTMGAGPVTVRQLLEESLAQATQQLTTALPNWAATPNGVAQLQALLQDVLTRAEAQRPGITTRPIPWTPPSLPGNEHFPPALYVGAPGEYPVGGADPTLLLFLAEPAARAMLAMRLSQLPAHIGTRLNERVRAPIFNTGAREIWVNGKPLEGVAILDTGAMPLLIGRAGMQQMGCVGGLPTVRS
jgi:hypothetical protein